MALEQDPANALSIGIKRLFY